MKGKTTEDEKKTEGFDLASWLDRRPSSGRPAPTEYVPKHRAEVQTK